MNILFLFFPFFRNKKYNPPILIHRNRLNFTKVLIILRFRLEEYFIVFRHEFLFFCCVSTIFIVQPLFSFHFRQDVMVPLSAIVVSAFNIFPAIDFLHCFVRVGENEIIFIARVDRLIRVLYTEAIESKCSNADTVSVAYSAPLFIPFSSPFG